MSIVMPCLNESETIGICIKRAKKFLDDNGIVGEILVSDNGSTDSSNLIAINLGARIVDCPVRGYGAALQFGIENANGQFILMGDSDDSYHFDEAFCQGPSKTFSSSSHRTDFGKDIFSYQPSFPCR
ncbi:MAG: glycosyltransferase [Nitrospirota bacterium]|nr:glycosyltransferase [Nitrospirota bacterium]